MFGLVNIIAGTVPEEDTEDDEDKASAVNSNNMNKLDVLTPPRSGTIQTDEAMDDIKSTIDDNIRKKINLLRASIHLVTRGLMYKQNYHNIPTKITLGTINYDLIYV